MTSALKNVKHNFHPVVWLYDPCNLIPNYTYPLASELAKIHDKVGLICGDYEYCNDLELDPAVARIPWQGPFLSLCNWLRIDSRSGRRAAKSFDYPLNLLWMVMRLLVAKPAVLHIQWDRIPIVDACLVMCAKLRGTKVVFTVHDVEPLYAQRPISLGRAWILHLADRILLHSQQNIQRLQEIYPRVDAAKFSVIPFGVSTESEVRKIHRSKARLALRLNQSDFVCAFVGNIKRYKGVDLLIEAARPLWQLNLDFQLLIAGRSDETALNHEIQKEATKTPRIRFENRYLTESEIDLYFRAADIIVLPYRNISQSGVVFRALASGRPVIAAAVGGLPEVVSREVGWLHQVNSPEDLRSQLSTAYACRHELDRMGINASQSVRVRNSWNRVARIHADFYFTPNAIAEVLA